MFPGQNYDIRPMSFGTSFGQDKSYFQSPSLTRNEYLPTWPSSTFLSFLTMTAKRDSEKPPPIPKQDMFNREPPGAQPGQQASMKQPHLLSQLFHFFFSIHRIPVGCCTINTDFFQTLLMWSISKAFCRISFIHFEMHHSWGLDDVTISFP